MAEHPSFTSSNISVDEGHSITLGNLHASLPLDEPAGDKLVVTLSGIPANANLVSSDPGIVVAHSGSNWTLTTTTELTPNFNNVTLTVGELEGSFAITANAVAYEEGSVIASTQTNANFTLTVNGVAEQPSFTSSNLNVDEGHSITLGNLHASLPLD